MTIEFLLNEFQEKDKEKIKKIIEAVQKKPIDRNVIFLKKFTLALLGQYKKYDKLFKKHERLFKTKEISDLHLQIKTPYIIKEKPKKILPQPPLKLKIEDFMPTPPRPLSIMETIPSPHLKIISMNIPKQELPQPKVIPETPKPEIKIPKSPLPISNEVPKPI